MSEERSKANIPTAKMSTEQREMIGKAVIEGLVTPTAFSFINPLATEGGDYDQNGGPYTQSGGGNHDQGGGGGYNQSSLTSNLDQFDVTNVMDVLGRFQR